GVVTVSNLPLLAGPQLAIRRLDRLAGEKERRDSCETGHQRGSRRRSTRTAAAKSFDLAGCFLAVACTYQNPGCCIRPPCSCYGGAASSPIWGGGARGSRRRPQRRRRGSA